MPSKGQTPTRGASVSPLKVKRQSTLGVYDSTCEDQAPPQRDRSGLHSQLMSKLSPNPFEATYRRPPELLPAHLQGKHATPAVHHAGGAQDRLQVPSNAQTRKAQGKRPLIRRVVSLASIPLAKRFDHLKKLDLQVDETAAVSLPGERALRPLEHTLHFESKPSFLMRSRKVVRKPFPTYHPSRTTIDFEDDPDTHTRPGQSLPLLAVNGVPLDEQQSCSERLSTLHPTVPPSTVTRLADPLPQHASPQKQGQGSVVRRSSLRKAKEVCDSCLEVASEISLLVDSSQVYEYILAMIKHAASAFRRLPRALHTLQSRDAEVWDLLSAARHVVSAVGFLVLVLSILAALAKVLKFVADIGACFWYPISLMLMMIRWMLLH